MVLRSRRPFEDFTLSTNNQQFNQPYSGEHLDSLSVQLDAAHTATGGAAVEDQAARCIAELELVHGTRSLARMRGLDLHILSHLYSRGSRMTRTGSGPSGAPLVGHWNLPLGEMIPGGGIDATSVRLNAKGRTMAAFTDMHSGTSASISGKLAISGESAGLVAAEGFYQPDFKQQIVATESANADEQVRFDFEGDRELVGFLLVAEDSSTPARSDGIVRNVRLDYRGIPQQEWTWGQLKEATAKFFRLGSQTGIDSSGTDMVPAGAVFLPTRDAGSKIRTKPLHVSAGTSLVLHLDTSSTTENEFTAITLASGDKVTVTPVAFAAVGSTASAAKTQQQAHAARQAAPVRRRSVMRLG
jgi:hypothetical protein